PAGTPKRAGGAFAEDEAADIERLRQRLTPNAAHGATGIEIDHHLIGGAFGRGAEKEPAVAVPLVGGLERDLDIAELAVGREQAAISRRVLVADDDALHNAPVAARAMAARRAVARGRRYMPARKARAIEKRDLARRAGRARENEGDEDQATAGGSETSHSIAIVAPPPRDRTSFFDTGPAAGV